MGPATKRKLRHALAPHINHKVRQTIDASVSAPLSPTGTGAGAAMADTLEQGTP
jgi:hypothetical protein